MKKTLVLLCLLFACINLFAQNPPFTPNNQPKPLKIDPKILKKDSAKYVAVIPMATASTTLAGNPMRATLVIQPLHIVPEWTGGNRDFDGRGPAVTTSVTIQVSPGGGQLEAVITMRAAEVGGDGTEAIINEKRTIAYAPAGRRFSRLFTSTISRGHYTDHTWELDHITATPSGGPVASFDVKGDTNGMDVGNDTDDDCFLNINFNNIEVETMDLQEGVKEMPVLLTVIAGQLRSSFAGTVAHINNFGPCGGGTCFKPRDSYIKFPEAIMHDTIWFPIAEIYTNARHYYFNNINLSSVTCVFDHGYIKASLNFESDEAELVGKCATDLGSFDLGCAAGTPSAQINNLKVTLGLRLTVIGGKLTYEAMDIQPSIGSNFSVDCGILDWLCGEVFKDTYQSSIYSIAHNLRFTVGDPAFVNQVADHLTPQLLSAVNLLARFRNPAAAAPTSVVDVSMDARNLLVRYR